MYVLSSYNSPKRSQCKLQFTGCLFSSSGCLSDDRHVRAPNNDERKGRRESKLISPHQTWTVFIKFCTSANFRPRCLINNSEPVVYNLREHRIKEKPLLSTLPWHVMASITYPQGGTSNQKKLAWQVHSFFGQKWRWIVTRYGRIFLRVCVLFLSCYELLSDKYRE